MVGRSQPTTLGAIASRYVYWTVPAGMYKENFQGKFV